MHALTTASAAMRARARDRAALHKLVVDLRAIALTAKPPPKATNVSTNVDKPPQKTQRTTTSTTAAKKAVAPEKESVQPNSAPLSQTVSKESDPASSGKTKTKKKKKKRSVLANQGNPHHVDNCESDDSPNWMVAHARPAVAQGAQPDGPVRAMATPRVLAISPTHAHAGDSTSAQDGALAWRCAWSSADPRGRGRLYLHVLRD